MASPFPAGPPAHEDELIAPAREGTLRVLRAARDAGVSRVVLTSSFAAIGYGVPVDGHVFDETDWSDPDSRDITAYSKSKTLAERAAWDFIAREGGALELAVVNPVVVFGPAWGIELSTSVEIVRRLLAGALPGLPRLTFGAVDVRDVADLHLRAMTDPAANGERFLAVAGDNVSLRGIAALLKQRLGPSAARVPTLQLPDWLVRLAGRLDRTAAMAVPELGKLRRLSNAKACRLLGWSPRSSDEAVLASAASLFALGLLPQRARARA
ncbi:aldehyde reductase [soil metagenome]